MFILLSILSAVIGLLACVSRLLGPQVVTNVLWRGGELVLRKRPLASPGRSLVAGCCLVSMVMLCLSVSCIGCSPTGGFLSLEQQQEASPCDCPDGNCPAPSKLRPLFKPRTSTEAASEEHQAAAKKHDRHQVMTGELKCARCQKAMTGKAIHTTWLDDQTPVSVLCEPCEVGATAAEKHQAFARWLQSQPPAERTRINSRIGAFGVER